MRIQRLLRKRKLEAADLEPGFRMGSIQAVIEVLGNCKKYGTCEFLSGNCASVSMKNVSIQLLEFHLIPTIFQFQDFDDESTNSILKYQ